MTGYEIENYILKTYKIKVGPNVIYTKLSSMERDLLVKCTIYGRGRVYEATSQGEEIINERLEIIAAIKKSALLILSG